jgi:RAD54-like protein 2
MFRTLLTYKPTGNQTQNKQNKSTGLNSSSSQKNLSKYMNNGQNKDLVIDLEEEDKQLNKLAEIEECLLNPCLVVCDEGHRIKNSSANIAKALQQIQTKRRVVLTGYPLQNNLIEYWCMVNFVRPNYLGTKSEFSNMFERPIMNGQCNDSTPEDIKLMRYRAHVLHSLLEGFVQRRGHDVFLNSLPRKQEFVILVKLSQIQKELYLAFMEAIGAMNPSERINPLRTFAICCKIWNHPDVLYKYNLNKDTDLDLDIPEIQINNTANTIQKSKSVRGSSSKTSVNSPQYLTTANGGVIQEDSGFNPFASSFSDARLNRALIEADWANQVLETLTPGMLENGAKIMLSFSLIEESVLAGDKILLFSQSLLSLNLIEDYLSTKCVPNTNKHWKKYTNYFRLDGSTTGTERERLIKDFNKSNNGVWLFLLSTRAGCLGINLIGANRVIVLDASWNPCHDAQAVCRVYRYGQKKNCFIYRLIADHTMEKKIYDRQISKQAMSGTMKILFF